MDTRFCKIFLPAYVVSRSTQSLDSLTVADLCRVFRSYNDYDYDAENVDWRHLRLRRTKAGGRNVLVLCYRSHEEGVGTLSECSVVTYTPDDSLPVRSYSFFYDFYATQPCYTLSEHNGDMTSTPLQSWPFTLSWHTVVEAVRQHERRHPLTERTTEVFPDI